MYKRSRLRILFRWRRRIVDHRVTDVAVVADDLAAVADVLAVVTAEATGKVKMSNVVRMRLPVGLHLRKEISLENALNFGDSGVDRWSFVRVNVRVVRAIEIIQAGCDR